MTEVVPFLIRHVHGAQALSESSAFGTLKMREFKDWQLTNGNWLLLL
jgi:hypothetical protein